MLRNQDNMPPIARPCNRSSGQHVWSDLLVQHGQHLGIVAFHHADILALVLERR